MNAGQEVRLVTNGEDTANQPGKGCYIVGRGFSKGEITGGRGGNRDGSCCGKESHFFVACLDKGTPTRAAT